MRRMFSENQIKSLSQETVEELRDSGKLTINNDELVYSFNYTFTEQTNYIDLPEDAEKFVEKYKLFILTINDSPDEAGDYIFNGLVCKGTYSPGYDESSGQDTPHMLYIDGGSIQYTQLQDFNPGQTISFSITAIL